MAERRMFHSTVVESDAFLDLPVGVQALYFHLGMHADDDGFINSAKQIARKLRRPPRELQQLIDAGFLLHFDGIMVIKHWRIANTLQNDRIKPLRYPEIAKQLYLAETNCYTTTFQEDVRNLFDLRQSLLESARNPKRKEKKGKEKKETEQNLTEMNGEEPDEILESAPAAADSELRFMNGKLGKGVVLLSEEQMSDLLDKLGLDAFDFYVEKLADFILRKQVPVTNHYATILKWWQQDKGVI